MEAHQDHDDLSMMESKRETNMMMKGRRKKRQRPSSPLALTMASTSSTTTTTTTEATSDGGGGGSENPNGVFQMSVSTSPSTNNSIEFTKIVQEDEEEDMANCLILLAQGQSHKPPSHSASASSPPTQNKTVAASGLYLYECKTCNRGFPSFQALGGHRASHKKPPKPSLEEKKPNTALLVKQDEDLHELSKSINSTTLSLQISPNKALSHPSSLIKAPKVHECSICGAEFTSGQALGGHMRRHRSMPMAVTACRTSGECQEAKKPRTLLSLDLNLPAPLEDDHRETQFPFGSKDKIIVFSSSLVDCHF